MSERHGSYFRVQHLVASTRPRFYSSPASLWKIQIRFAGYTMPEFASRRCMAFHDAEFLSSSPCSSESL